MAISSTAFAQEASTPESPTNNEDPQTAEAGEAIIVTAQKRNETLIEVPQSVTVVGQETLERQQATTFQDYIALVPGLSLESSEAGVNQITLRGVNTGGVASTVSVYMDEVPFGSSTGLANGGILSGDFDPFDIARLEILRGPQGTLYGASSLGGVIKYVSNAPRTDRVEVRGLAGVEHTKGGELGYQAAGVLNVPISDMFAIRASGFYRKQGGYIDSIGNNPIGSFQGAGVPTAVIVPGTRVAEDINDRETYGGRLSALFKPTDALSIRLTAFAQDLKSGDDNIFAADPETFRPLYRGEGSDLVQSSYIAEPQKVKYRVYSGTLDWDLGFASLVSSTSYSKFDQDFIIDANFDLAPVVSFLGGLGLISDVPITRGLGVFGVQSTGTNKFTQEVRLSSPDNDRFEWLVGGFYTNEKSRIDPQDYFASEPGTTDIAGDVQKIYEVALTSRYKEIAGFANATVHFTDRFDLTAGARYSHNEQNAGLSILGAPALVGEPVIAEDLDSSESVFTYSVAPRFELSDDVAVYARVASGYRPGGPNIIPIGAPADTPRTYDADRLTSYEVGIKGDLLNRRLSFEAALFRLDWKDIQLFAVVNDTGINVNGGTARVNGVEFSATARPFRGLRLSINGAYTDAELTEDTPPASGGLDGDPLPYVPKLSGAVLADYEFPIGAGDTEAFIGGTLSFTDERPAGLGERDEDENLIFVPSYETVDLRAGVNFQRFTIQAFVRNLFNTRGVTSASGFAPGENPGNAADVAIIRPRTIGLTLSAEY
jgi:outer membrane receptor protein involved in Fe transport